MKKTYTKPMIQFEDFTLSVSIASGCKVDAHYASGTCAYTLLGGATVFTSSLGEICQYTEQNNPYVTGSGETAQYNGICYHVPIEGNSLFES